jgi:hypothetical protein
LEPSKERSDQAAKILTDAVKEARSTLRLLQVLNVGFFVVGIGALAVGLYMLLFSNNPQAEFAGGLISVTAFIGLVLQMIREPLDRIQKALNKLVQIETAFTSFIWELNLNGTYIQSQYVARGVLDNEEVSQTVERIESAMHLAMDLVAVYAEEGRNRIVPHVTSISPSAGTAGEIITVYGEWLSGGSSIKRFTRGTILVNHLSTSVEQLSWNDEQVTFRLSDSLDTAAKGGGTVWISLIVNGRETNSVPFHYLAGSS